MTNRCEDCGYWDNSSHARDHENTGACRVSPPKADRHTHIAYWPFTEDVDSCGSFRHIVNFDVPLRKPVVTDDDDVPF